MKLHDYLSRHISLFPLRKPAVLLAIVLLIIVVVGISMYLLQTRTAHPEVTHSFISAAEATKVVSTLPEGFLFDKSLKGKVTFSPEYQPTSQKPYWGLRIFERDLPTSGTLSWVYVDARNSKLICSWYENGKPNRSCIDGTALDNLTGQP